MIREGKMSPVAALKNEIEQEQNTNVESKLITNKDIEFLNTKS
jgi:hypothetical protein